MKILHVNNVHTALPEALELLLWNGVERDSRNGAVLQYPTPVSTVYTFPMERVLFHPWRDANPFFHFYESLWMLAGRNDVKPLTRYVKRMASFSDDGEMYNAAYGFRWRQLRGDQLKKIVKELQENPLSRRCVLQIWDADYDLGWQPRKDIACNLTVTFQVNSTRHLDMVVFCRSNDIIWGCYGANAVHFSVLQEYIASCIRVPPGTYTQVSVNWHAYRDVFDKTIDGMNRSTMHDNPYGDGSHPGHVEPYPLMQTDQEIWDQDVQHFVTDDGMFWPSVFTDPFFIEVASPIVQAHDFYKGGKLDMALLQIEKCKATDWRKACTEWLLRRKDSLFNEIR